jgi:hypothetical protein
LYNSQRAKQVQRAQPQAEIQYTIIPHKTQGRALRDAAKTVKQSITWSIQAEIDRNTAIEWRGSGCQERHSMRQHLHRSPELVDEDVFVGGVV